ncbi:uncharacterized protein [Nicotiana tomentosiformis]|uniref:uncharacterized protein n=1 Tax=Nicotiana tomentosiformis TaxID=4098 RepID=UPI00388C7AE7
MNEDLNNHPMDFKEIMNTFLYNGVSHDAVYLRVFPFTLKDDAKHWLHSLPNGSIRTWDEMTRKFLDKYFSSAKTYKFRREIHNFCQNETETVFEDWERFKEIVRKSSRRTLSNAAGGPLMKKTPGEIVATLNELSEDANQWPSEITERRRSTGVHQVDANTSVQKHPIFSWSSPGGTANAWQQNSPRFPEAPSFVNQPRPQFQPQHSTQPGLEDLMKSFIVKTNERLDVSGSAIKELGTGTIPTDIERNPKEMVKDVTLRNGKLLKDPTLVQKEVIPEKEVEEQLKIEVDKKKKDMLRHVNVNLPFTKVLSQMPAYEKFLKEILTKKRKIEETSVVKLTEHCSVILQNKLPQKCGDPGSFTIPFSLCTFNFDKSLCDSGDSINLMPLSIYRKLENELGEIRSAPISLH